MTMGSKSGDDEAFNSPVPLRVEAAELSTLVLEKRKRKLSKPPSSKPKKYKGSSSTTPAVRAVEVTSLYLELSRLLSLFIVIALVNFSSSFAFCVHRKQRCSLRRARAGYPEPLGPWHDA